LETVCGESCDLEGYFLARRNRRACRQAAWQQDSERKEAPALRPKHTP